MLLNKSIHLLMNQTRALELSVDIDLTPPNPPPPHPHSPLIHLCGFQYERVLSFNSNLISELFSPIDLHTACAAQSDIERGTDVEMDIDLE